MQLLVTKYLPLQYHVQNSCERIPTPTAGPYAVYNGPNILARCTILFSSTSATWTAIANEVSLEGLVYPSRESPTPV